MIVIVDVKKMAGILHKLFAQEVRFFEGKKNGCQMVKEG
jgi:hypothetical protein